METRFYCDLELFFNENKEYCIKLNDEIIKNKNINLVLKGKDFENVYAKLKSYLYTYYLIIEKNESDNL